MASQAEHRSSPLDRLAAGLEHRSNAARVGLVAMASLVLWGGTILAVQTALRSVH